MEELQPQEIEELLQELEEKDDTPEMASKDVEELLYVLQHGRWSEDRWDAAERLGRVEASTPGIVQALLTAYESDPHPDVSSEAGKSLQAAVHEALLEKHPDLREAAGRAVQEAAGGEESGPEEVEREQVDREDRTLTQCLKASAIAGLAIGLLIGVWQAGQSRPSAGGIGIGVVFLIALAAGAVVGILVSLMVASQENRAKGMLWGAVVTGAVACLSWFPVLVLRILRVGGP